MNFTLNHIIFRIGLVHSVLNLNLVDMFSAGNVYPHILKSEYRVEQFRV